MSAYDKNFGLMIAFLLPGFICLAGIAPLLPVVAQWLHPTTYAEASLGPPVYAILLATALGMIASCVRWLLVDHLHRFMGVPAPSWDDSQLETHLAAFDYIVENHYRYYQFFANSVIAIIFAYAINRWRGAEPLLGGGTDVAAIVLCTILFVGSRDALQKYYARSMRILRDVKPKGELSDETAGVTKRPRDVRRPQ